MALVLSKCRGRTRFTNKFQKNRPPKRKLAYPLLETKTEKWPILYSKEKLSIKRVTRNKKFLFYFNYCFIYRKVNFLN